MGLTAPVMTAWEPELHVPTILGLATWPPCPSTDTIKRTTEEMEDSQSCMMVRRINWWRLRGNLKYIVRTPHDAEALSAER